MSQPQGSCPAPSRKPEAVAERYGKELGINVEAFEEVPISDRNYTLFKKDAHPTVNQYEVFFGDSPCVHSVVMTSAPGDAQTLSVLRTFLTTLATSED